MIRKLLGTIIFIAIGAGGMYYALGRHFVNTDDGYLIVPKAEMGLADTHVDIRQWKAADFREHPQVTAALVEHGHQELVIDAAGRGILDSVKEKLGDIFGPEDDGGGGESEPGG